MKITQGRYQAVTTPALWLRGTDNNQLMETIDCPDSEAQSESKKESRQYTFTITYKKPDGAGVIIFYYFLILSNIDS